MYETWYCALPNFLIFENFLGNQNFWFCGFDFDLFLIIFFNMQVYKSINNTFLLKKWDWVNWKKCVYLSKLLKYENIMCFFLWKIIDQNSFRWIIEIAFKESIQLKVNYHKNIKNSSKKSVRMFSFLRIFFLYWIVQ